MRKAINRLLQWVYHPSIRHDPLPRGKATIFRYPSPGNNLQNEAPEDYKKPFTDSKYNIRYRQFTHEQSVQRSSKLISVPPSYSVIERLVGLKFLKPEQVNNKEAVQLAKKQFEKAYGVSSDTHFLRNDFPISDANDREGVRQSIAENLIGQRLDRNLNFSETENQGFAKPDLHYSESLDFYSDPHQQRSRLQNETILEEITDARAHGIDIKKGEANFWKALDDSNDSSNIKKVQQKIGDSMPLDYELRNGKVVMQFDSNGNVIDLHRK